MKLVNVTAGGTLTLPNDMLWEDEFDWSPVISEHTYSTTGALFVDQFVKQAGRPISLRAAAEDMCWVPRSTAQALLAWAGMVEHTFRLELEYPGDTRTFNVIFNSTEGQPVTAVPVAGFPGHSPNDWFRVTIKLTEV